MLSDLDESVSSEKENHRKIMSFLYRWLFLILSTLIVVFYSEKVYWYIQGYSLFILLLVYIVGVYLLFRLISVFHITDFWPFLLAAIIYPLYVEGFFTGIVVADITFLVMLSYFIGWHTLLSVILGWYFHRQWLINREYGKLWLSSILIGLFWGVWSIVYWTPRQINDPDFQNGFRVGQWPVHEFFFLSLFLIALYIGSHYLLGRKNVWQSTFHPSKLEDGIIFLILVFFLFLQFLSFSFLILLLLGHLCLILFPLHYYSKNKNADSPMILEQLEGRVEFKSVLIFSVIPFLASGVYWFFTFFRPPDAFIDSFIYDGTVFIQLIAGLVFYIVAIINTIKRGKKNRRVIREDNNI